MTRQYRTADRNVVPPTHRVPAGRAFTLVELLVVISIIALLISILLPSLCSARQQTKNLVCLSNLRTLGQGVMTYSADYKGTLPGPLHPAVYRDQSDASAFSKKRQLTWLLKKSFHDNSTKADSITDRVATCPVMSAIVDFKSFPRPVFPTHYVINNVGDNNIEEGSGGGSFDNLRTTTPSDYFGFSPWLGAPPEIVAQAELHRPQSTDSIKRTSEEWMIADAWYRGASSSPFPDLQQEGPYQWKWSGEAFPNFAPHPTKCGVRSYIFTDSATRTVQSAKIRSGKQDGRTNTAFFDGHAEPVRSRTLVINGFEMLYGFRGTVNGTFNGKPGLPPGASWQ
ncbi:MAG: prepilin-type N-terminal cleavage/methylation domain-containing protein [bacterium]|nr:prepilin-type N-terminal cleavage/methylation domain-containing protein [bacterium]